MITYDPPSAAELAELKRTGDEDDTAHMIESGTRFVCWYENDVLVGALWFVGTGFSWWTVGIHVDAKFRRQGIGTKLREAMIKWCEENTLGSGQIIGFYDQGSTPFWENMLNTETYQALGVGMRKIQGISPRSE